jgi:oligogalacturonide lyase
MCSSIASNLLRAHALLSAILLLSLKASAADEPPTDWIDPATGHRILRLSTEPGTASLYFHQNAYTDAGKLFVTITEPRPARGAGAPGGATPQPADNAQPAGGQQPTDPSAPRGRGFVPVRTTMATIDLSTLGTAPPKIDKLEGGFLRGFIVGHKSGNVYYVRGETENQTRVDHLMSTNLQTHETREIGKLPFNVSSGLAINADETLIAGSYEESTDRSLQPQPQLADGKRQPPASGRAQANDQPGAGPPPPETTQGGLDATQINLRGFAGRERNLTARLNERRPMRLFTVNTKTGEVKTFNPSTDWLNHVQLSPTDPNLMMFCHEGTWELVDRIWTTHVDGTGAKLMHPRTMQNEIAGHEFFGFDGRSIWYDLQTPRSDKFWLASVNLDTGERLRYPIERGNWSVHYNQSHDGKLYAGDGGGPGSVANRTPLPENRPFETPQNGQWIFLFTPQPNEQETMKVGDETVKIGHFAAEKLVDLSKHNYELEPNLTFSPDNKWIIFRSNMHGPTHVYAVELAKHPGT